MVDKKVNTSSKKTSSKKAASKKTTSKKTVTKKSSAGGKASESDSGIVKSTPVELTKPIEAEVRQTDSSGKSSSSIVLAWIALVCSGLALCAGGYAWYLTAVDSKINVGKQESRVDVIEQRIAGFDDVQTDMGVQISQLRNLLTQSDANNADQIRAIRNELNQQESAVREQIQNSDNLLKSQTDHFRLEFETLSNSIVGLRSELGRSLDSWTLEEAEQLIYIANQRLQFAGEVDLAKQALQLADQQLTQLSDPGVNDVRRQLSLEINQLDSIVKPDITGVLNDLNALSIQINQLPLSGDTENHVFSGNEGSSQGNESSQQSSEDTQQQDASETTKIGAYLEPIVGAGAGLLESLGDLIQVEKAGESVKPIISGEIRRMTYEKTKLILESAQIALIRHQSDIYVNRIQAARDWVVENFDQSSSATKDWVARLDQMQSAKPTINNPDISGSLRAIRALKNSNG